MSRVHKHVAAATIEQHFQTHDLLPMFVRQDLKSPSWTDAMAAHGYPRLLRLMMRKRANHPRAKSAASAADAKLMPVITHR
jgi:hypothetical protein